MKKLFGLIILLTIANLASAQLFKGQVQLGGSAGYQSSESTYYIFDPASGSNIEIPFTYKSYNITPSVGFFVSDKLVLGVSVGYSGTKGGYYKSNSLGVGVFGSYYSSVTEKFGLLFRGALGYYDGRTKYDGNPDYDYSSVSLTAQPGLFYILSDRFMIESTYGSIGVSSNKQGSGSSKTNFSFNLSSNTLNIGFKYLLKKGS